MAIPGMKPTAMTREEFIALLDDIKARVDADDSMEGNLTYEWSDDPGVLMVMGAYRVGNQYGQGGIRLIGDRS